MKYRCVVVSLDGSSAGSRQELVREAADKDALVRELTSPERYILSIEPLEASQDKGRRRGQLRLSGRELLELTESLSLLFNSGLTVKEALGIAEMIFEKGRLTRAVGELNYFIERGKTLAEAVEAASMNVPPIFSGMVKIGEKIGGLDTVFPRLVSYLRTRKELRDKTINALFYPALVFVIAVLGSLGIVFFLMPRMEEVFAGMQTAGSGDAFAGMGLLQTFLPAAVLLLPLLIILTLVLFFYRSRGGEKAMGVDRIFLRMPVLGRILTTAECLTLTFGLETLLGSGIPMEQALTESREILGSPALRGELTGIREKVVRGTELSDAFRGSDLFPAKMAGWLLVGERTGKVGEVFGQLRRFFQGEYEKYVSRFMNMIEPVLIVGIGIFLLILVMVFIVPMFSLYGSLI